MMMNAIANIQLSPAATRRWATLTLPISPQMQASFTRQIGDALKNENGESVYYVAHWVEGITQRYRNYRAQFNAAVLEIQALDARGRRIALHWTMPSLERTTSGFPIHYAMYEGLRDVGAPSAHNLYAFEKIMLVDLFSTDPAWMAVRPKLLARAMNSFGFVSETKEAA
jgi:hypothetical protein